MSDIDKAIAEAAEREYPRIAKIIRDAKRLGEEKSSVVEMVTASAGESHLVRLAVLTLVDEIWKEP